MTYTAFGREMEAWEYRAGDFCKRAGYARGSSMHESIFRLSTDELKQVTAVCDPQEDCLVHVDSEGFSVNHGSVGSRGVVYDFH